MFNNKINDFFYSTLSLSKEEVKIIDISETLDNRVTIDIKWKKRKQKCLVCGKNTTKTVWDNYEIVKGVKHLHISNYKTVELNIHKRRYICNYCTKNNWWKRKTFMEHFSFINKNCHYTSLFKSYILKEWRYQSLKELSRKFKVSNTLVYKVLWTVSINTLTRISKQKI